MATFKLNQLRSYLFFFDVIIQNGGISSTVRSDFEKWAQANRQATEAAQLTKILELRLKTVNAKFVNDVRTRKTSIINGSGTVHGISRNYMKEFCAELSQSI